ncbi:MAG: peptidoglycan DD-metalloendopeptidase family protein [Thermodesulfovibrionales bacterium]|nr:peptidoglycan DD-metalloendopeptidase family protein [Thermodesulfovibrionales bacterium]
MRINHLIEHQTGRSLEPQEGRRNIREVSKELESLFLYELLKIMRRTVGSQDSLQKDVYTSLFDLELSKLLAERGTGLQKVIERQLLNSPLLSTGLDLNSNPVLPADGAVTSKFGERLHPLTGKWSLHKGIDIAAPYGSPVRAVRDGKVIFSGYTDGYGNLVVIDHGDGILTRYAHNRKNMVKEGDRVKAGDIIAEVGSSGLSTGAHLHFEVFLDDKPIDPERFFKIKDRVA